MKNTKFLSIIKAFKDHFVTEPMISLCNSFELQALLKSHGWRFIFICFPKIRKITHRLKILKIFGLYILSITKRHGQVYTVKYLKHSTLAIQKHISGNPLSSLKELDNLPFPRLAHGLPVFIPLDDRKAIRRGDHNIIRFWISLYSLYRIIKIPGIVKLNTITDPFTGKEENLINGAIELRSLTRNFIERFNKQLLTQQKGLLPIEKSSPSSRVSWLELFEIPSYLKNNNPVFYKKFERFMEIMGQDILIKQFNNYSNINISVDKGMGQPSTAEVLRDEGSYIAKSMGKPSTMKETLLLGRLARKDEPAGKVRIFAMVDVWTQSMLKPLHDSLFSFLKNLPNDGTFNQYNSILRCKEKARKAGKSFGYDLSAATDRLPISLQVSVLDALIGKEAAQLWRDLLVDRSYQYTDDEGSIHYLRYAVGQPMGALSSWAMLAITHHLIVQLAYRNVFNPPIGDKNWYENYEILGDDIVLFEESVAKEYLRLMENFGLAINLGKSVISNNGSFEFAKVSSYKGINVSAIPFRMLISNNTRLGRVSNVLFFIRTIGPKRPISYMDKILKHGKTGYVDNIFNYIAGMTMFLNNQGITYTELLKALISVSPLTKGSRSHLSRHIASINKTYISNLLVRLIHFSKYISINNTSLVESSDGAKDMGKPSTFISKYISNDDHVNNVYWIDSYFHRTVLIDRLLSFKDDKSFDTLQLNLVTDVLRKLRNPEYPHAFDITNNLVSLDPLSKEEFDLTYIMVIKWFTGFTDFYLHLDGSVLNRCSLDKLISLNKEMESFITLSQLVLRANKKVKGDTSAYKVPRDYNLKALDFIIKSNKDRPLFTYSPAEVQWEYERIDYWWRF